MLITVPDVLNPDEVAKAKALLESAEWVDGKVTAGHQSSKAKDNQQIPEGHPEAKEVGDMILKALAQNALFMTAALPHKIFPPLFNRYTGGQAFGTHVDNAIRQFPGSPTRIRTDLSATLFFEDPENYEGGELCVEDTYGVHQVKLPAGSMVLYPSTSLHHVTPVTRGSRLCSFFWLQSMIRDDGQRSLLLDLDLAIQRINNDLSEHETARQSSVQLTGVYHNLLRQWAEM